MAKPERTETEEYGAQETAQRMENAIRRALNTPPKPHSAVKSPRSPKATHTASDRPARKRGDGGTV
jgi:hypothetical protein